MCRQAPRTSGGLPSRYRTTAIPESSVFPGGAHQTTSSGRRADETHTEWNSALRRPGPRVMRMRLVVEHAVRTPILPIVLGVVDVRAKSRTLGLGQLTLDSGLAE